MGIKHFWKWFKDNFGQNITYLCLNKTFKDVDVSVDNLMIDLNGLFHSSTQKIYEYGNGKPKYNVRSGMRRGGGGLKLQIKVFEDICMNIESLLLLVKPNKRLILCVDGPAPLSKQSQQRQRRFKSVNEKTIEEFSKFDSNCITPGTKFMDYLTKYIDWYIKKSISDNPAWRDIEVVFSDEKSPGEGEHKIINYIRVYGDPNDSFCIHGMDADLIMLSLGTGLPKFWVLREDMFDRNNKFFLIDIGNTRQDLTKIMDWRGSGGSGEFIEEYLVNDFIFLCFMVGNDFLPHIPSLEIIEDGIYKMLDVYKSLGIHLTEKVDGNVVFINKSLELFLSKIAECDKAILENKLTKKHTFFPDSLLEKNSTIDKGKYVVDIEHYRIDYYLSNFSVDCIDNICHQYLVGLQWVLSYYTRGVPDWQWCFQYHYAPFAHELADSIKDFILPEKRVTNPITPFQQLLCVLPPKSSKLIPFPLSELLTDPKSNMKKFCPDTFDVDLSGKRQEWEGIVLLPMVDFNVVKEEYFKTIDLVSKSDLRLNVLGKSVVYRYNDKSYFLKSFYGNIERCSVRYNIIDL